MADDIEPGDISKDIKDSLRKLMIATIVLYVVFVTVFIIGWIAASNQREDLQKQTDATQALQVKVYAAMCSIDKDFDRRIAAERKFLTDNPEGVPGFSPERVRANIVGLESIIIDFAKLGC